MDGAPTRNNARRDFYERIGGLSMAPLWESLHQLVPYILMLVWVTSGIVERVSVQQILLVRHGAATA